MSNKTTIVTVGREGVQFGPHAWYSHEKITGIPLAVLSDPNSSLRSLAACNYWNWVAEALNRVDAKGEPHTVVNTLSVDVKVDDTLLTQIRETLSRDERILFDIADERRRQDEQWGGPDHDDTHRGVDWLRYINRQSTLASNETLSDDASEVVDPEGYRARLVKIAALAVAAIESHDRKLSPEAADAEPRHFVTFGKTELLDYLDAALPEEIGIRNFSMDYWAQISEDGAEADKAMQRALASTREFNGAFVGAASATVAMDFTDSTISIGVEG